MSTQALRPWADLVKLHPDVEAGALTEAVFAIAAGDPNVPVVNRDPEAFFRATYLTADLRKLLEEVLASLAGQTGYNRVLKLRTPFGGGKSHTLAALYHAARKRCTLDLIAEAKVSGDEVLPILQRRLLGAGPNATTAAEVATAYQEVITGMKWAQAETTAERLQAQEEGVVPRDRMRAAYPFHPALIDIMRERWTAVDAFQRTRGALRFLASCMYSLKRNGGATALLGAGDVPLKDVDVRVKLLKELGAQNDYDPVITADIEGPNARAKRIDERMARETPALGSVKPATRIATAQGEEAH